MQHHKIANKIPSYFYYINNQFWFNTTYISSWICMWNAKSLWKESRRIWPLYKTNLLCPVLIKSYSATKTLFRNDGHSYSLKSAKMWSELWKGVFRPYTSSLMIHQIRCHFFWLLNALSVNKFKDCDHGVRFVNSQIKIQYCQATCNLLGMLYLYIYIYLTFMWYNYSQKDDNVYQITWHIELYP